MTEDAPSYRREFLKSRHHAWLGVLTLGLGFASGMPLLLLGGATAYVLGWIHLPDMAFFRASVDRRRESARQATELAAVREFTQRRDSVLATLSSGRRSRYETLAGVCRDIEGATVESQSTSVGSLTMESRLRKLDDLMWTFLRLLSIEQTLEVFLETERREELPRVVEEADAEVTRLKAEMQAQAPKPGDEAAEGRKRLLNSREDRLQVLVKRLRHIEHAQSNLALVRSEQDRLAEQIKLIRADAFATKNAEALSVRIDASVEHLDETNKWLAGLDEFKDLAGDMPLTSQRVGFEGAATPPVIPGAPAEANRARERERVRSQQ